MDNAAKSPVLGVGMGAFWVGPVGYDMYPLPRWSRKTPEWRPEEGHNGFLDVYVELGAVGLVLLLIVIGIGVAGGLDDLQTNFPLGTLRLTLMLSILMNNIAETSFLKGTHDLWFLFLLVAVNLPRPIKRTDTARSGAGPRTWRESPSPSFSKDTDASSVMTKNPAYRRVLA
jgi:O-antigen ligase